MAINAKDRFARLPKARQEKILARAQEMIAEEMSLAQLREACLRSQAQLAEKLGVKQAAVSRLERRTDMYLSTLRDLIASMGGTLRIIAEFPDRPPVCINQFHCFSVETASDRSSCLTSKEVPIGDTTINVEPGQSSSTLSGSTGFDRHSCKEIPERGERSHRRQTK